MPSDLISNQEKAGCFISLLNKNLLDVQTAMAKHHSKVLDGRRPKDFVGNYYQKGDFVLYDTRAGKPMQKSKLTMRFEGPYEVIVHEQNDVTARHLVSGVVKIMHVNKLKLFTGSKQAAFKIALLDADQHVVEDILDFRGDPAFRTEMSFQVLFADGDIRWVNYSADIAATIKFEDFCRAFPPIRILLTSVADNRKMFSGMAKTKITSVKPGDRYFISLRAFGFKWYDSFAESLEAGRSYVVEGIFTVWKTSKQIEIYISYPVFGTEHGVTNVFISQFCYNTELTDKQLLVTKDVVTRLPVLKSWGK